MGVYPPQASSGLRLSWRTNLCLERPPAIHFCTTSPSFTWGHTYVFAFSSLAPHQSLNIPIIESKCVDLRARLRCVSLCLAVPRLRPMIEKLVHPSRPDPDEYERHHLGGICLRHSPVPTSDPTEVELSMPLSQELTGDSQQIVEGKQLLEE